MTSCVERNPRFERSRVRDGRSDRDVRVDYDHWDNVLYPPGLPPQLPRDDARLGFFWIGYRTGFRSRWSSGIPGSAVRNGLPYAAGAVPDRTIGSQFGEDMSSTRGERVDRWRDNS